MTILNQKVLAAGVVTLMLISVFAMAGTSAAVQSTVDGPDEVVHPDTITLTSTVEIREDERVPIDNFTVTIQSDGDPDRSVDITFAPNGTILDIEPDRGVIGAGEIRINQLERTTDIRLIESHADHGYGERHGYDERTDEFVDFGYGYGYGYGDAQPTFVYEIELDARAFKHGTYDLFVTVNGDGESGLFQSNVHSFDVLLPSERAPQGPPDDAGPSDDAGPPDDSGAPDDAGPPNDRGPAQSAASENGLLTGSGHLALTSVV